MATSLDPMSMVGANIDDLMQTYYECEGQDTGGPSDDSQKSNDNQKSNSQNMNMDMDFSGEDGGMSLGGDGGMDIGSLIGGDGGGGLVEEAVTFVAENPEVLALLL